MKPLANPPKQRLFIYDRKEMAVLVLLGVMVALFAFTLGVHLGKRVNPGLGALTSSTDIVPAKTASDALPDSSEIAEQTPGAPEAVDTQLDQALRDEVAKTGIALEHPRQVKLPSQTKSKAAGATTLESAPPVIVKPAAKPVPKSAANSESKAMVPAQNTQVLTGKYALQVGSHRVKTEAEAQVRALEIQGLKPYVRTVNIKGRGQWHRVFVGGYATIEEANKMGVSYRADGYIESFVVAPRPN